jgi:probable HAF family extracellular repeat protein
LVGCGGDGGGDSAAAQELVGSETTTSPPVDGGTTPPTGTAPPVTAPLGALGALTDLGDLLAFTDNPPPGDHWYFTKAAAINDDGIIIGQSNQGSPVKGAFSWDPGTKMMTFLGIQSGVYEDFYGQRVLDILSDSSSFIYSEAVGINSSGTVIGNSTTGLGWPDEDQKRAFMWKNGEFVDIAPLPGKVTFLPDDTILNGGVYTVELSPFSEAVDINNEGEIVFTASDHTPFRHAYYWDGVSRHTITLTRDDGTTFEAEVTGPYIRLGGIVGEASAAVAINENGQAVVNSESTAVFHDLNWDVVESLNHLPGFGTGVETKAVDINDSVYTNNDGIPDGHVIGNSGINGGNPEFSLVDGDNMRGFFWDGGPMYPVGDLGGGTSAVTDLNNKDQVVGAATLADGSFHAILWALNASKKGVIRDLGTLGGANSYATAINEAGQVTGWAETGQFYEEQGVVVPIRHAFLWDQGIMFDLGTHNDFYVYPFIPSFPFSEAVALNASGEVAGNSITINAHSRGFYLSPVFP